MTSPSYILELELLTNTHSRKVLDIKLEVGRNIYNACLVEARKRLRAVFANKEYRSLVADKKIKDRIKKLKEIERSYGYSEYQLHKWSAQCKRHFEGQLGSQEVQKLATRAFKAMERVHYRKARKVRFKSKNDAMSIENKSNKTGLRLKDKQIIWGELKLSMKLKSNDEYAHLAMMDKTKFVRVLKREIRGKQRYFVQLVQEGYPPTKSNRKFADNETRVGLDVGTSTIAIVSNEHVELRELAPDINPHTKVLRRIERLMDRSKHATNPDNFNLNGTVGRGCKWVFSNHYKKLRAKRKDIL